MVYDLRELGVVGVQERLQFLLDGKVKFVSAATGHPLEQRK